MAAQKSFRARSRAVTAPFVLAAAALLLAVGLEPAAGAEGLDASAGAERVDGHGFAASSAQQPERQFPPSELENLQVLPADTTPRQVINVMRGFTTGLGVRCEYCHVGEPGADLATFDFVSDAKPAKEKARVMWQMVMAINEDHIARLTELGASPDSLIRVGCSTCHHGQPRPLLLQDILMDTFEAEGLEATLERYDSLRERYYGGYTYDFGENALIGVGQRIARGGDVESGIALLNKNLELYPESVSTQLALGQAFVAAGDTESARAAFTRCLELAPDARPCAQGLERLQ